METYYQKMYPDHEAMMLSDLDAALTTCNLWDWLAEFTPQSGEGFMFTHHPNLDTLNAAMTYQGHSGSSYAWTMRTLQRVARLGRDAFAEVMSTETPPCPCRRRSGKWAGRCGAPACEH